MTDGLADLLIRPYRGEDDLPEIVRIVNAELAADGRHERWSLDGARAWFSHPSDQFDPIRDVVLATLDGRVVGAAAVEWVDTRDGALREYRLFCAVDPESRRRGIGTTLLADNERRARRLAAAQQPDRPVAFGSFALERGPGSVLLEENGYRPVRWFFEMIRPTLDDLDETDDLPLPDGLELRPVGPDQHLIVWRANREAFRDHWGGSDESEEQMRRVLQDPDTDTSLWLIAWDGDEVAGGVWNAIHTAENAALGVRRGWLESVFTRRAWRRRGLATALIARSLLLLRERGMTSAALGVDAANPSGALGMYEAAGFVVHERNVAFRKAFELPGR